MFVFRQVPPPGTSAFNAYRRATGSSVADAQVAYAAQQAIPPTGTSAHKAYQFNQLTGRVAGTNLFPGLRSGSSTSGGSPSGGSPSGGSPAVVPPAVASQPQTFDYLDAPWASAYGMSRETAYSEALHNTSYQRAVKDMVKAGLNPAVIFGAGNGSTSGVPAYVSSASSAPSRSGSGSSGSGHSSSSRKSSEKLFSSSAYSVMSALGGIVGSLATHSAGGYWIGTSLTQGAMNALSLLSKASKKR